MLTLFLLVNFFHIHVVGSLLAWTFYNERLAPFFIMNAQFRAPWNPSYIMAIFNCEGSRGPILLDLFGSTEPSLDPQTNGYENSTPKSSHNLFHIKLEKKSMSFNCLQSWQIQSNFTSINAKVASRNVYLQSINIYLHL